MILPHRKRRPPAINIVPMLDILTILLIFFVVTTTFKRPQPAVRIDLPTVAQAENVGTTRAAIITLTADLRVFLDELPVTIEELPTAIKMRYGEVPETVALRADRSVPLGELLRLTETLRAIGIQSLPTFTEVPGAAGSSRTETPQTRLSEE